MNNNIVISLRIDSEIQSYIMFLKKHKVRHSLIIREAIRNELRKKCKDYKIKRKVEYVPF